MQYSDHDNQLNYSQQSDLDMSMFCRNEGNFEGQLFYSCGLCTIMGKGDVKLSTDMCTMCGFTLDHELRQNERVFLSKCKMHKVHDGCLEDNGCDYQ